MSQKPNYGIPPKPILPSSPQQVPYILLLHPSAYWTLVEVSQKERWKDAYRLYRKENPDMKLSAPQILEKYGCRKDHLIPGYIKSFEGMRWLKSS
jgi:hypothetical protein